MLEQIRQKAPQKCTHEGSWQWKDLKKKKGLLILDTVGAKHSGNRFRTSQNSDSYGKAVAFHCSFTTSKPPKKALPADGKMAPVSMLKVLVLPASSFAKAARIVLFWQFARHVVDLDCTGIVTKREDMQLRLYFCSCIAEIAMSAPFCVNQSLKDV